MAEWLRGVKAMRVIFRDPKDLGSNPRPVSFYERPKLTIFLFFIFFSKKMVGGQDKQFKTIDFGFFSPLKKIHNYFLFKLHFSALP